MRYVRELKIELVEIDDLSEADRGSSVLSALGDGFQSLGWSTFVPASGGAIGGAVAGELKLDVAGGTYYLSATLAKSLLRQA